MRHHAPFIPIASFGKKISYRTLNDTVPPVNENQAEERGCGLKAKVVIKARKMKNPHRYREIPQESGT